MAVIESIEGSAGAFWFHYDLSNDVVYLRHSAARDCPAYGEESDVRVIALRSQMTIAR